MRRFLLLIAGVTIACATPVPPRVSRPSLPICTSEPPVAQAAEPAGRPLDLMLLLDVSESTAAPSEVDVDGDGRTGRPFFTRLVRGPSFRDSILAAEVAGAKALLDQLDPSAVRIGVVAFAGTVGPMPKDAWVWAALTHNFDCVRTALEQVRVAGPQGLTNTSVGIRLAWRELATPEVAASSPRSDVDRVMILITDGFPTLPHPQSLTLNANAAIMSARNAARRGVIIHVFDLKSRSEQRAEEKMAKIAKIAEVTGGSYTRVSPPGAVIDLLPKQFSSSDSMPTP